MSPVDEVGTLHQHHTAVAAPSVSRPHIGHHHIERLAVFTAEDMRVSHTLCEGDGVALDDREAGIERGVVIAVIAEGITDLFFFGSVAREIGKEVRHFSFVLLGMSRQSAEGCKACKQQFLSS